MVKAKEGSQRLVARLEVRHVDEDGHPVLDGLQVVEFEEGRRIAWQTRGPGHIGKHVAGRIWRYELEPVEGGTLVRESWDITQESA